MPLPEMLLFTLHVFPDVEGLRLVATAAVERVGYGTRQVEPELSQRDTETMNDLISY